MKKVSIIIPVYNTAKYLADCIKSVIEQTLNDIEIIIINDGSTDQSEKIIKTFCQKDNRIIYIYQNNTGVSCVRNKGIEFANGEYIFFLDSDDLIGKHFLENLYNTAKTNNSEIVITKPNLYNNLDTSKPSTLITHAGFYNLKFLKNNPDIRFPTGKNLNREDGVFAHFALSKTEKISICNNALYYYRQNPEQITSQITRNPKLIFKTIVPILNYIEGFYTTNNLWYSNRELLAKYIQDELFYSCFYSISR